MGVSAVCGSNRISDRKVVQAGNQLSAVVVGVSVFDIFTSLGC